MKRVLEEKKSLLFPFSFCIFYLLIHVRKKKLSEWKS